jgi:hypothetical protein
VDGVKEHYLGGDLDAGGNGHQDVPNGHGYGVAVYNNQAAGGVHDHT